MSTDQEPENQIVAEDGLPPDVMARIKEMDGGDDIKVIDPDPIAQEPLDTVDVNLDAEPPQEAPPEGEPPQETPPEGEVVDFNSEAFEKFAEEQGVDADELASKILENRKLKVKVKGQEKEMDYHQIKSTLSREETFQKKFETMRRSNEMKLGTLMKAAQEGDAEAAKKIQGMLISGVGVEDADDLNDKLEDVKGEFDEDSLLVKTQEDDAMDAAFADVKEGVDFQDHMDTIENRLKEFMPQTVYEQYWTSPESRRAMYNLAASGRLDELTTAFESEFNELSLEKQLELEGNPELYGRAFISVIRKQNAKKAQTGGGSQEKDPLDSVSSKARPKTRKSESNEPTAEDIMAMTPDEFHAYQDKLGIRRL